MREPQVFLFDEPLSNLDAELRVQMRVEIAKLHNDLGATMIYVTHDQVEAMTLADKIVVLRPGVIEQVGRPLDLYNNPRNQFVAGFIGSPKMNFLDGKVKEAATARRKPQGRRQRDRRQPQGRRRGWRDRFGVRPEHIGITEGSGVQLANVKVDLVEQLGGQTMVYATTADGQAMTIAVDGQRQVGWGHRDGVCRPGAISCVCAGWAGDLAYQAESFRFTLPMNPASRSGVALFML